LPEAWDQDAGRRAKATIPDDVRHVAKWQLALDIVDELIAWGLQRQVVQADGGYGDITAFRLGLEERDLEYVVQVKGTTSAQPSDAVPVVPAYKGMGRPPRPRYADKPQSLRDLALTAGQQSARTIGWREGDRGPLSSSFIALRVRPANDAQRQDDGVLPACWLLAEWPEGKDEPVKYWLSNLPADTQLVTLVQAAKLRWRVEHDYRELKQCLGLDHYEGRTYRGLQHHLTCVTVAHAFLTTCRLQRAGPDTARPQTAAA
jgi:SRSO17 transposase